MIITKGFGGKTIITQGYGEPAFVSARRVWREIVRIVLHITPKKEVTLER